MSEEIQKKYKPRATFEPNCSPNNPVNLLAAKERGLRFDPAKNAYVDEEGSKVLDRFGQPF